MPTAIVTRYRAAKRGDALLPEAEVLALTRVRTARSLAAIGAEWAAIAAAIALYEAALPALAYPLLVAWIGARQLGLWVLAHDGLHGTLLPQRAANDAVARLLCAWPVFVSLSAFREVHLRHHRELGGPDDPEAPLARYPEFRFPKSRRELATILLLDALGINFVRYALRRRGAVLRALSPATSARGTGLGPRGLARSAFTAAVVVAAAALGVLPELVLYWLVPYATVHQALLRLRLVLEHQHVPADEPFAARSIVPNALERWLLVPHGVHHHVEHHLYPSVPGYNLPALHERLRPALARAVPLRRGVLRTLGELTTPAGRAG